MIKCTVVLSIDTLKVSFDFINNCVMSSYMYFGNVCGINYFLLLVYKLLYTCNIIREKIFMPTVLNNLQPLLWHKNYIVTTINTILSIYNLGTTVKKNFSNHILCLQHVYFHSKWDIGMHISFLTETDLTNNNQSTCTHLQNNPS